APQHHGVPSIRTCQPPTFIESFIRSTVGVLITNSRSDPGDDLATGSSATVNTCSGGRLTPVSRKTGYGLSQGAGPGVAAKSLRLSLASTRDGSISSAFR